MQDDRVVTSGGRVLCATALGDSVGSAQKNAYALAAKVDWQGCFYRTDIGYRAIARERGEDQE
ncbi:phosphoribosylamine-glycine ligase [Pseudomonas syringae pv. actinidiae]|nr:phosphoribosylamine-glycine ligase [Pseudomonas syringae pv. actinidiae]